MKYDWLKPLSYSTVHLTVQYSLYIYPGMNGTMKEFPNLHQSGKTEKIFFVKSKSIGRQRQLDVGEKKYLNNLYIVCLTYEIQHHYSMHSNNPMLFISHRF